MKRGIVCCLALGLTALLAGCTSKPGAEIPKETVAFDNARDGTASEKLIGPGGGGGAGKGKGKGGGAGAGAP
jgi:hypothetical protein